MGIPEVLVEITAVDRTQDLVIIDFSDDTTATFTTAELMLLRPVRDGVLKREPERIRR